MRRPVAGGAHVLPRAAGDAAALKTAVAGGAHVLPRAAGGRAASRCSPPVLLRPVSPYCSSLRGNGDLAAAYCARLVWLRLLRLDALRRSCERMRHVAPRRAVARLHPGRRPAPTPAAFCCVLLRSVAFCCVLLRSVALCCVLLRSVALLHPVPSRCFLMRFFRRCALGCGLLRVSVLLRSAAPIAPLTVLRLWHGFIPVVLLLLRADARDAFTPYCIVFRCNKLLLRRTGLAAAPHCGLLHLTSINIIAPQ